MATASIVACAGVASGLNGFRHYELVADWTSGSVRYVGSLTGSVQHGDKLLSGVALVLMAGALARGAWRLRIPRRPLRRTRKRLVSSGSGLQRDRRAVER